MFRDRRLPSPYNADTNYITIVLDAIKKFEDQPNCREMIHDKMVYHIEAQQANWGPNSLEAALTNWLYLGRFAGCRSIEWCQRTQKACLKIDHPTWKGPESHALIGEDVLFHNSRKQLIPEPCDVDPDNIDHTTMRF